MYETTKIKQNTAKSYPYFVEQSTYTHMKEQNGTAYLGYLNAIWKPSGIQRLADGYSQMSC